MIKPQPEGTPATILQKYYCGDCGWPIVDACCNFDYKDSLEWDWWYYCSNKSCKNHDGEGVFQVDPEWVVPYSQESP